MRLLKSLVLVGILCFSSCAHAGRTDLGKYKNWEAYRLDFTKGDSAGLSLCAVRGYLGTDSKYKVILAAENTYRTYLYLEHIGWEMPANYSKNVRMEILDESGSTLHSGDHLLFNDSDKAVPHFRFSVNSGFVFGMYNGASLLVHTNTAILAFHIQDGLQDAMDRLFKCSLGLPEHEGRRLPIVSPRDIGVKKNPFE